jgi:hypothetical protein
MINPAGIRATKHGAAAAASAEDAALTAAAMDAAMDAAMGTMARTPPPWE